MTSVLRPLAEEIVTMPRSLATRAGILLAIVLQMLCAAPGRAATEVCTILGAPIAHTAVGHPTGLAVADFNNDGIADIATGSSFAEGVGILLGQGSGGVGNGSFAAPIISFPGNNADALVAGDFDDDGIQDLAIGSGTAVHILAGLAATPGVGSGSVGQTHTLDLGSTPSSIVAGDFDGDGITDLAVITAAGNLHVLRGQGVGGVGSGGFFFGAPSPVGYLPSHLVTADFNHDGILDLACTLGGDVDFPGHEIAVMLGQGGGGVGNGSFAAPALVPVGSRPQALAVGDFNEDGAPDMAAALFTDSVAVVLGNGSGGFGAAARYNTGHFDNGDIVVGDYTNDGIADLLLTNFFLNEVEVLKGGGAASVGDGTFPTRQGFAAGSAGVEIAAGDFNGDHVPDVVVNNVGGQVSTLPGGCFGLNASLSLTTPNGGELLAVGAPDTLRWTKGSAIMAVNLELSRNNGLSWKRLASGLTGTSFVWHVTGPATAQARVRVLDATAPDRADSSNAAFSITCPPFGAPTAYTTSPNAQDVFAADYDGDGILDLFVLGASTHISVFHGNGVGNYADGTFTLTSSVPPSGSWAFHNEQVVDADMDGALDVLFSFVNEARVLFFKGLKTGGRPNGVWAVAARQVPVPDTVIATAAGDFNEDGIGDLAASMKHGAVAILLGQGQFGVWNGQYAQATYPAGGAGLMQVADLNRDGIADLVVVDNAGKAVRVLLGNGAGGHGDGTFAAAVSYPLTFAPTRAVSGDFNEDGAPDLAVTTTDGVAVLPGHLTGSLPDGTFGPESDIEVGTLPNFLAVADVTGDDIADLLVQHQGTPGLAIVPGTARAVHVGSGTFSTPQAVTAAGSIRGLAVGDFLTDQVPDVAVGDNGTNLKVMAGDPACQGGFPFNQPFMAHVPSQILPGTELALSWFMPLGTMAVDLDVTHDDGQTWVPIAHNLTGTSYVWTVVEPVTDKARIRVRDSVLPSRVDTTNTFILGTPLGVAVGVAGAVRLAPPAPNPAHGASRVALTVAAAGPADVSVYDVAGRLVRSLTHGWLAAGTHTFEWDGRGSDGHVTAAGLYFVRARAGGAALQRTLVRVN
jgi:flagellar hook capping protein FlgD/VCBS repeat protein/FG-GAP repeat protein